MNSVCYGLTIVFPHFTEEPKITLDVNAQDLLFCPAGSTIRIPASFKGRPMPKVSWEFEGGAKTEIKDRVHVLPVNSEVSLLFIFLYCYFKEIKYQIFEYQLYIFHIHDINLFIQIQSSDATSVITIPVCNRSHSGRYTITAKNKAGQKSANVRVNVLGELQCDLVSN